MRLSTRILYGVQFMLDLAIHHNEPPIALRDICEREAIPEKYLWNLITPLKAAGLVRSVRGSQGGYTIVKSPSEITLNDIVNILEGPLCLVESIDEPSSSSTLSTCVTRDIWIEASDRLQQYLESITLDDMVRRRKARVYNSRSALIDS